MRLASLSTMQDQIFRTVLMAREQADLVGYNILFTALSPHSATMVLQTVIYHYPQQPGQGQSRSTCTVVSDCGFPIAGSTTNI
jgi:hypothetical protein